MEIPVKSRFDNAQQCATPDFLQLEYDRSSGGIQKAHGGQGSQSVEQTSLPQRLFNKLHRPQTDSGSWTQRDVQHTVQRVAIVSTSERITERFSRRSPNSVCDRAESMINSIKQRYSLHNDHFGILWTDADFGRHERADLTIDEYLRRLERKVPDQLLGSGKLNVFAQFEPDLLLVRERF